MSGWSIKTPTGNTQPSNAFIPSGGFSKWQAALTKAGQGTGVATAAAYGASIIAGGTAITDMLTKSYWALWRQAKINAGYGIHGDTMLFTASANFNTNVTYSAVPFTFDQGTTWVAAGAMVGPWPVPTTSVQTTIPIVHYTHPSTALGYNARSIRLFYFDAASVNGRTWSANIDGGANSNVTGSGDNTIHTLDFTGLTNAANHVLNIGNQGSANICVVPLAVASYPTTTIPSATASGGIHYCWWGVPGSFSLSDVQNRGGIVPDLLALLIGPSNSPAPYTANAALSPPFAPDLLFLDVFDDMSFVLPNGPGNSTSTTPFTVTGGSPSTYLHGLRRIAQSVRQKSTGCDVVHHIPNFPDGVVSDNNPGATYQLQNAWHYYQAQKYIAEMFGHGWLNTDAEWGERGDTLTFLTGNNPHPTNAGHNDIFTRIGSRLGL